uniref:signal recognition particle protein n=1 Tax=Armatimonas sp. TaxID=1872638 RepID=UPI00286B5AE5
DVDAALREVRMALLEADVNFKVVKNFVARVKERAMGENILEGLQPAQMVIKFVHEEMIATLSGTDAEGKPLTEAVPLTMSPKSPTVIMLCGLQGAGKTTLAGKLGAHLKKLGRQPLLAACDLQRPAAVKQLEVVGGQVKVPVYAQLTGKTPVQVAMEAVDFAKENRLDVVILDTAGRLHVDEVLMDELKAIKAQTKPDEILLVLDAMTGQDAVNVATQFNDVLEVGGFVLTKVDGDARGGAAISVRAVVGKPIKLVGVGEKLDALEVFHPERMASRILGMGDVLTLIEKAEAAVDEKQAAEMEKKLKGGKFDFEDFLSMQQQMKRLGPLEQLFKLIPGVGTQLKDMDWSVPEKEMAKVEAIIRSMTAKERRNPELINGSRRKRIAAGAGVGVPEINQLLNQFEQMRRMMRAMSSGKGMPGMPGMPPMPGMRGLPAGNPKKKKDGGSSGGGRFKLPFR